MRNDLLYDVFLSYNSNDRAAAESLARWLMDEGGLRPFFDKWDLAAGDLWIPALGNALGRSRACAILIGPDGPSPWVHQELQAALMERAENPEFRVIPVLLPGIQGSWKDLLPRFLKLSQWIELGDLENPEGLHALAAGIRGLSPGRWRGSILSDSDGPYRGLQVFEEEHSRFFFGREAASRWLVEALGTNRFLAVIGPSGSGKSSLVRAGLVAELRRGGLPGSESWPVIVFRPGRRPLEQMALAFTRTLGPRDDLQAPLRLMDQLAADRRQLHFAARMLLESPETRIVLVVDQFEEVFTLCHLEEERRAFLDSLLHATEVEDGQVSVVVTLRADFYGRCATQSALAKRITQCQMLVGPMSPDELRSAIERPARLAGLELDPGLVEILLEDLSQEPGSLPLLQHALLELWNQREGRRLTFAAYRRIGGVRGAIAHRAEAVFAAFEEPRQLQMRRILLRLTQPGEGTEDTRRRVSLTELLPAHGGGEEVEATLQALAAARLLTIGTDERGEVTVDIAHEALIRHWSQLRSWIEADRDALRIHRRLTGAAEEWERNHRDESYLYTGARLASAKEWAGGFGNDLSRLEREFLNASATRYEERQQQDLIQAQALLEAERQRARESERLRFQALSMALALQASQAALNPLERGDLSAVLAFQAYRFNTEARGYAFGQVDRALRLGLGLPQLGSLLPEDMNRLVFSPNSQTLAGSNDGVIKLWDVRSFHLIFQMIHGEPPAPALVLSLPASDAKDRQGAPLKAKVEKLAFSPDGKLLAALENRGALTVWDLAQPESPRAILDTSPFLAVFRGEPDYINPARFPPLCFTPDSRSLVLAGKDGSVRLWNLEQADKPLQTLIGEDVGSPSPVFSMAFRLDGLLAVLRLSGRIEIFDPEHPSRPPQTFSLHDWHGSSSFRRSEHYGHVRYSPVSFSPNGTMLSEGKHPFYGARPRVSLWNLSPPHANPVAPLPLKDAEESGDVLLNTVISPEDRFLAVSTVDSSGPATKIWHLERPASPPFILPWGGGAMAFSPDGKTLASGGRIWHISRPDPTSTIALRLVRPIRDLAFSPDGTVLAASTRDSLHLYDLRRPEIEPLGFNLNLQATSGEDFKAGPIVFSRDGRKVALGLGQSYSSHNLFVWDLIRPEEPPCNIRELLSKLVERPWFDFLGIAFEEEGILTWLDRLWSAGSPTGEVCRTSLDLAGLDPGLSSPRQGILQRIPFGKAAGDIFLSGRDGRSLALLILNTDRPPGQPWLQGKNPSAVPILWRLDSVEEDPVRLHRAGGQFMSFALSDAGKKLAAGSENRTVALWDWNQPGAEPLLLAAYQDLTLCLAFSPDGTLLAGGGDGAMVQLWDLRQPSANPAILEGHRSNVLAVAFSPDGRFLATGDRDGIVRVWITRIETLADLLSSRVKRAMTDAEWRQFVGRDVPRSP